MNLGGIVNINLRQGLSCSISNLDKRQSEIWINANQKYGIKINSHLKLM